MKSEQDKLIDGLQHVIHFAVKILAVLMTFVILWGVWDVAWTVYQKLVNPPFLLLDIHEMLATFGAFMAVLIAIEIFVNIIVYLKDDVLHVKIVLATALMAIARKVIILDYDVVEPAYIYSTALTILALSLGYWLIGKKENSKESQVRQ